MADDRHAPPQRTGASAATPPGVTDNTIRRAWEFYPDLTDKHRIFGAASICKMTYNEIIPHLVRLGLIEPPPCGSCGFAGNGHFPNCPKAQA